MGDAAPRQRSLDQVVSVSDGHEAPLCEFQVSKVVDPGARAEMGDQVLRLLRGLSSKQRAMMILYHVEGLTMREVGAAIGVSESQISLWNKHIMQILRERSKGNDGK